MFWLHVIVWVTGGAVLIFRLYVNGPDPFFLLDAMMIAFGSMCLAHATALEAQCREMRGLFRQNTADSYENERLKEVIAEFERLTNELD